MKKLSLLTAILGLWTIGLSQSHLEVEGKAKIENMDTVISSKSNVVVLSDGTLAIRQYKVGDFAQGGIIFWVSETGEHGLVADTTDLSSGIQWYNGVAKVLNSEGDGFGAGEMNTTLIVAQQTVDNTTGIFAALLSANLVRGDYGDWYLPSKEELNWMYENRAIINTIATANGGSNFASDWYWSSTENLPFLSTWLQNFGDGSQDDRSRDNMYYVRAIREF